MGHGSKWFCRCKDGRRMEPISQIPQNPSRLSLVKKILPGLLLGSSLVGSGSVHRSDESESGSVLLLIAYTQKRSCRPLRRLMKLVLLTPIIFCSSSRCLCLSLPFSNVSLAFYRIGHSHSELKQMDCIFRVMVATLSWLLVASGISSSPGRT